MRGVACSLDGDGGGDIVVEDVGVDQDGVISSEGGADNSLYRLCSEALVAQIRQGLLLEGEWVAAHLLSSLDSFI